MDVCHLFALKEVKLFASHLHSLGKYWQRELFGWQTEYAPESDKKLEDSKMTFTAETQNAIRSIALQRCYTADVDYCCVVNVNLTKG